MSVEDTALFRVSASAARGLQRLGVPPLTQLSARDRDGYALAFAYIVSGRLWSLPRAASWPRVHAAWSAAAEKPGAADALSGTLHPDDTVRLVASGAEGFTLRDQLYAGARETIDIATYYVQSDETGWATARALAACAARGVRVRLLMDRFAIVKKRLEVKGMQELLDFLPQAGTRGDPTTACTAS